MADKTREDIRTFAERPVFEYVDGYVAQIMSMKPAKNQQNVDCWKMVLNPSDKLTQRYDLKQNEDGSMFYEVDIPIEMIIQLNADPSNTRWFCLLNYEGHETHVSTILLGVEPLKDLSRWKEIAKKQTAKASVATERMMIMENNLPKHMKRNFAPMLEQLTPIIKEMVKKKDD